MKRWLPMLAWLLLTRCSDRIDSTAEALATEPDDRMRGWMTRQLDPDDDPERLLRMLDVRLQSENDENVIHAMLKKLGEITDPSVVAERDRVLFRWARAFHSPWNRANALEALCHPGVDTQALREAFSWCVRTYPDPGEACVGFAWHVSDVGEEGARMLADAGREGDPIVAYYAARFACWKLDAFTTHGGRLAVRDALIAAQSKGVLHGQLNACVVRLANVIDPSELGVLYPTSGARCVPR